jgi:hypothetical protein
MFVGASLLRKPKRYLSSSQREALDLFVCTKLIEQEKPAVLGFFLDSYLHPQTDGTKTSVALYVDDFASLDQADLFFNVFILELEYLGDKIFGRRRDEVIIDEVNGLIDFLKPIAGRTIGDDEVDLNFTGHYCRVEIVLVGKPAKLLTSIEPYVSYIQKSLVATGVETIYLLSRAENQDKLEEIATRFMAHFDFARRRKYQGRLKYSGEAKILPQYLIVLRRRGVPVIQASVER